MPALPTVKAKELVRALLKMGFFVDHQKGSHARLIHSQQPSRKVTIPMHNKDLPKGALRNILRQAEISVDELKKYL